MAGIDTMIRLVEPRWTPFSTESERSTVPVTDPF